MSVELSELTAEELEAVEALPHRDIGEITEEILEAKRVGGEAILTIGRGLIEAKAQLPHGEWLPWLTEQVEFSERSAQNFMQLAREWSNPQTLADLGASKALALLALPPSERDEFVAGTHSVNGQEKTVDEMSARELKQAIKERDEARKQLKTAQKERQNQKDVIRTLKDNAEKAMKQIDGLSQELDELKSRPVEVAVQVDEEAVKKAEAERDALRDELERVKAEKPTPFADDSLMQFKVLFEQVQETVNRMKGLKLKLKDPADAENCGRALLALADYVKEAAA